MASKQELLAKLEERLTTGDIDRPTYDGLRAQLLADLAQDGVAATPPQPAAAQEPATAQATAGGQAIHDSVIKGNISNVTGAASVGSVVVNVQDAGRRTASAEVEYEQVVLMILRSGGRLDGARSELESHRQRLGLSLRLAQELEAACYRAAAGMHGSAGLGGPATLVPPPLPPNATGQSAPWQPPAANIWNALFSAESGRPAMQGLFGVPVDPAQPVNRLAQASFWLGLLGLVTCVGAFVLGPAAIILGSIAHSQAGQTPSGHPRNKYLASAGIILGALSVVGFLVFAYISVEGI